MTSELTIEDLETYIRQHAIRAHIVRLTVETPTVEAAARAVKTTPDQIVKSLLFLVHDTPMLAIACGMMHVDRKPIAAHCGVGRKHVKLADAEQVLRVTGFPVGAVPPFGGLNPFTTVMDEGVFKHGEIYAGGGAINALLCITPQELARATNATVLNLLGRNTEGES